ncbi:MAG TPA: type I methionyl aminopeptidase [Planctomycetota bacterium]|nr:type I methionyl aminopeptidase [Planctomycetota bacterium]
MITLKSERELERIRIACRVVAEALARVRTLAKPGVTTAYLDKEAEKRIIDCNAEPAFKGHGASGKRPPFPASACTSVNEEVVHGIPGERVLLEGDLLSVDIGARYAGYYGDGAATLPIGRVSVLAQRLMDACRKALRLGIRAVGPGRRLADISRAIQRHVEANGFSVVRDLVGHGIGSSLWEEPQVPNFYSPKLRDVVLRPGMVIAIEPMINAGGWQVKTLSNRWTVVSCDGSLSAHFEHTVCVTRDGVEVLTLVPGQQE